MREVQELQKEWHSCIKCPLHHTRTRVVHGAGKIDPTSILIVGEAPGENEDIQGEPFVGDAGMKLAEMIMYVSNDDRLIQICESEDEDKIIDLKELKNILFRVEEIFLDNVVACRPPDNRDPNKLEMSACWPRLEELIYILDPLLIIAAGRCAFQLLLGSGVQATKGAGIQARRGILHTVKVKGQLCDEVTYPILPILHPSFLVRQPDFKIKNGWADKTQNDLLLAVTIVDILKEHYYGIQASPRINRSPFPPREDQTKERRRMKK